MDKLTRPKITKLRRSFRHENYALFVQFYKYLVAKNMAATIIVFLILFAVVCDLVSSHLEKLRQEKLRRVAPKVGLTYSPNELAVDSVLRSIPGSVLIEHNKQDGGVVGGVLTGKVNSHDVTILDYKYQVALRVDLPAGAGAEVCRPRANPLCVMVCPPSGAVTLAGASDHKRQVVFLLAAAEHFDRVDQGVEQLGNRQVIVLPHGFYQALLAE